MAATGDKDGTRFEAVKAGDWYCETCPDNGRGQSGICYWWTHELGGEQRCAECNKRLVDEEQGQRICELCSAGVPCSQDDPVQSA